MTLTNIHNYRELQGPGFRYSDLYQHACIGLQSQSI